MKEMDRLTLTDANGFVSGFQDNHNHGEELDEDSVIIQLIVQGKPITVNEHILTKYSKYFWNLFQTLPPLPKRSLKTTGKGKFTLEEEPIEETLVLKHNSTTKNVWNNELEVKNRSDEDPLSRIAYETMKTIIDFLYKLDQQQQKSCSKLEEKKGNKKEENFSDLKVTEKNVEQLLLASDLLIISKVEETCLRFLELNLSMKNCLDRFELLSSKEDGYAKKCSWKHPYSKTLLFIQMNFQALSLSSYFYKCLSFQRFYKILSSDCLGCRYEDQVLRSIIIWLEYRKRLEYASILLSLVQWQLLVDIESIKRDQFLISLMNTDVECRNIVEAGLFYHNLSDEELVTYWENLSTTKKKPSRWPKMLIGLCYADSLIESYDFEDNKWTLLTERIGGYSYGSELCYVPTSGKLYVIGGVQSKDVDSYCVEKDTWKHEAKMNQYRIAHGVVVNNDRIHVMGGSASAGDVGSFGVGVKGLEVMDIDNKGTSLWQETIEMNEGRNYAGTCIDTIEEKIYVVAGCLTKKSSTAEVFDIKTSTWTNIADTNTKRDSPGVIHVPQIGRVYSIGGYNNRKKEYLKSAEKYNPDTNKWIPLGKSMKVATRKPGVVTYRGRIYVVGGMGKEKDLNFVQIFNPVTEEWEDNDIGVIKAGKSKNVESNASDASVPPLEELCGWMSCCLIDKPLRLMKERKQHLLNDVRNNLQNYECCKELSLELCNTEEICSNQSPQEIITQEKLQKGEPWSTKTQEGNGKSSLPQCNNKTRTVNNIECENARTGLRMKQRKEFQTGSGL